MAHFARVDENNIVVEVQVIDDENEHRGQEYLADDLQQGGTWIQTSYNTRRGVHVDSVHNLPDGGTALRWHYATRGAVYDPVGDRFSVPKPHDSWVFNHERFMWEAPIERPVEPPMVGWDEETTSWVERVEQ